VHELDPWIRRVTVSGDIRVYVCTSKSSVTYECVRARIVHCGVGSEYSGNRKQRTGEGSWTESSRTEYSGVVTE
jgi:hypothetical protein